MSRWVALAGLIGGCAAKGAPPESPPTGLEFRLGATTGAGKPRLSCTLRATSGGIRIASRVSNNGDAPIIVPAADHTMWLRGRESVQMHLGFMDERPAHGSWVLTDPEEATLGPGDSITVTGGALLTNYGEPGFHGGPFAPTWTDFGCSASFRNTDGTKELLTTELLELRVAALPE